MNPKSFFGELKRRNVYKVAIAYGVVAWLLIQIATQVFPFFEIPNWAVRLVVLLLIIGFPVALILAWAFELTPEGLKRTETADAEHLPTRSRTRTWIYVVVITGAISIGVFYFGRYRSSKQSESTELSAKTIAETLQANLSGKEKSAITARPTENSEAHDLYLRGRYFFGKRTVDDFKRAIDYFNQAIAKDPNYAPAYAGLADSYVLLPEYSGQRADESLPKARWAANKALELDSNLAEAHTSLGLLLFEFGGDLHGAKREFERAIELNPNYAAAHYFLGLNVLAPLGQLDQAVVELKRAVELDPFSVIMNANFGHCYILARRYPEAIAQLRKATELDPNFGQTHVFLGHALEVSGDSAGAIGEYEKAYEVENAHLTVGTDVGPPFLAYAYALQGEQEKALQLLGQLEDLERRNGGVFAFGLARVHLRLGQKEQAIDWLERSYLKKELPMSFIKVNPELDPLRGDARFEKLANQIIPPGDTR